MFIALLVTAALIVPRVAIEAIRPLRMVGPAVKHWSGWVLVVVGGWFLLIAVTPRLLGGP